MADRYWVAGTGNWSDDDNHWATSSGGAAADGNIPTSADNVIFDTSSSVANAAYTVTMNAAGYCLDFTMDGPDPADATKVTLAGSNRIECSGSLNLSGGTAGITNSWTGTFMFLATSGTKTITTNSIVFLSEIRINGSGGTFQLKDNLTTTNGAGAGEFKIWAGTFTVVDGANNWVLSAEKVEITSTNTAILTLGSATHLITGKTGLLWYFGDDAVLSANTSTIKLTGALTGAITFAGGGKTTYNNFWNATTNAQILTITGSNTFADFKIDAGRSVKFTDGTDQTVTSLTWLGTEGNLITLDGTSTAGWKVSDTTGTNDCDYIDIHYSTAEGGATFNPGIHSVNSGNNSGWNFPSAVLTGTTIPTITETDVVSGGKTIIITLTNDTWVATVGEDNAITTALIAGIDSAQAEATGWDAVVKAHMVYTDVARTSNTVVTVTLGDEATYNITSTETITVTIPATALTSGTQVVATPTFTVTSTAVGPANLKSYNTNLKANIKLINTNTIANCKSYNTNV